MPQTGEEENRRNRKKTTKGGKGKKRGEMTMKKRPVELRTLSEGENVVSWTGGHTGVKSGATLCCKRANPKGRENGMWPGFYQER